MSPRIATTGLLIASFLLSATPVFGAVIRTDSDAVPTPEIAESIYRTCKRSTGRELLRCESRALARWRQSLELERPRNAINVYDNLDLGKGRLRTRLQEEILERSIERGKARQSYREIDLTQDDINTDRHAYLKEYRVKRRACMVESPGRPRSLCFDRIGNEVRDIMRAERLSR